MSGSLVCLPTQFSGGELVIRHHGRKVKFDSLQSKEDSKLHAQSDEILNQIFGKSLFVRLGYEFVNG